MARRIAGILVEELADGSRKLTHPSGVICVESAEERPAQRREIADEVWRLTEQLKPFDRDNREIARGQ